MDCSRRLFESNDRKLKLNYAALVMLLIGLGAMTCVIAQESGVPDYDGEFFTDLSGKIPSRQKVQISRTLRNGAQSSRIHPMLVVMNKLADYPNMPQDLPGFMQTLANDWKIGDQETKKGVLILFSLQDRKFGVEKTTNLDQALTDKIKSAMVGRVTDALKEGDTTKAMLLAADNIVELLPDANLRQNNSTPAPYSTQAPVKTITRTVHEHRTLYHPYHADYHDGGFTGGNGFGFWWLIGIVLLFVVFVSVLGSIFGGSHGYGSGMGGSYYGGGYGGGGGGGFFSGMLTGGLFGYLLGDHSSYGGYRDSSWQSSGNDYIDTTTTETWTEPSGGGGNVGGGNSGSSGGSGGSGFDSFGGGNFDGGGSFGNW